MGEECQMKYRCLVQSEVQIKETGLYWNDVLLIRNSDVTLNFATRGGSLRPGGHGRPVCLVRVQPGLVHPALPQACLPWPFSQDRAVWGGAGPSPH